MNLSVEDLNAHLQNHLKAHDQLSVQVIEVAGVIKFLQKLLAIAEQKKAKAQLEQSKQKQQAQGADENGGVNGEEKEQVA